MIFALEGNFAYSFMLGVLAAVNPCGFVLLPAYLLYFLGIDSDNKQAPRSPSTHRQCGCLIGFSVGIRHHWHHLKAIHSMD